MKRIHNERDEALAIHYMILSRQMAELSATLLHIFNLRVKRESAKDKEREYIAYRAFAKIALGDMICQMKKICKVLNLDFNEAGKIGKEKDEEKKQEYLQKYPEGEWF